MLNFFKNGESKILGKRSFVTYDDSMDKIFQEKFNKIIKRDLSNNSREKENVAYRWDDYYYELYGDNYIDYIIFKNLKEFEKISKYYKITHPNYQFKESYNYIFLRDYDDLINKLGYLKSTFHNQEFFNYIDYLINIIKELKNGGILSEDNFNYIIQTFIKLKNHISDLYKGIYDYILNKLLKLDELNSHKINRKENY